jgi:hypothetical protein
MRVDALIAGRTYFWARSEPKVFYGIRRYSVMVHEMHVTEVMGAVGYCRASRDGEPGRLWGKADIGKWRIKRPYLVPDPAVPGVWRIGTAVDRMAAILGGWAQ